MLKVFASAVDNRLRSLRRHCQCTCRRTAAIPWTRREGPSSRKIVRTRPESCSTSKLRMTFAANSNSVSMTIMHTTVALIPAIVKKGKTRKTYPLDQRFQMLNSNVNSRKPGESHSIRRLRETGVRRFHPAAERTRFPPDIHSGGAARSASAKLSRLFIRGQRARVTVLWSFAKLPICFSSTDGWNGCTRRRRN